MGTNYGWILLCHQPPTCMFAEIFSEISFFLKLWARVFILTHPYHHQQQQHHHRRRQRVFVWSLLNLASELVYDLNFVGLRKLKWLAGTFPFSIGHTPQKFNMSTRPFQRKFHLPTGDILIFRGWGYIFKCSIFHFYCSFIYWHLERWIGSFFPCPKHIGVGENDRREVTKKYPHCLYEKALEQNTESFFLSFHDPIPT